MPKGIPHQSLKLKHSNATVAQGEKIFPGTTVPLPDGVSVRSGKGVQIDFMYQGRRCTETIKGKPTVAHVLAASEKRERIIALIGLGKFVYESEFPDSRKLIKSVEPDAYTPKTVGEAMDDWFFTYESSFGPNTHLDYARDILRLKNIPLNELYPNAQNKYTGSSSRFAQLQIDCLTKRDIVHLQNYLASANVGPKRITNICIPLRGTLENAMDEGEIKSNPFEKLRKRKKRKSANKTVTVSTSDSELDTTKPLPFTELELEAILAKLCVPLQLLVRFWKWTGLRTGELIALQWSDVRGNKLYVGRSRSRGIDKDTKTGDSRFVDLHEPALELLKQLEQYRNSDGYIFHNPYTKSAWTNESKIRSRFKNACDLAGVVYRRPYHLRHTFASNCFSAGLHAGYIAKQLGHADWIMLLRVYAQWVTPSNFTPEEALKQFFGNSWPASGN